MADRVAFGDRPCRPVEQCRADGSASKDLDVEPIAQHPPTDERNGRSRATRGLVRPLRSPALATLLVFRQLAAFVWAEAAVVTAAGGAVRSAHRATIGSLRELA